MHPQRFRFILLPLPSRPTRAPTAYSTNFNLLHSRSLPFLPLKHIPDVSRQDSWENNGSVVAQSSLQGFAYAAPLGSCGIYRWRKVLRGICSRPLWARQRTSGLARGKTFSKPLLQPINPPWLLGAPPPSAQPTLSCGLPLSSRLPCPHLLPVSRGPFSLSRIQSSFSKLSLQHSPGNVNLMIFFLNSIL